MSSLTTKSSVMILYTGGTIGCKRSDPGNPDSPLDVASLEEFKASVPSLEVEGKNYKIGYHEFDPPLDSTNMEPEHWAQMVEVIEKNYDDYSGFVILHGTDTMVYTASALSFMITNLTKPIIVTGSQLPIIGHTVNDGEQNLVISLRIAAQFGGIPVVPEVCIFFRDHLFRGNRCRKINASGYRGFATPNYPTLGEAGEEIKIKEDLLLKVPDPKAIPSFKRRINTNIIPLPLFPGIQSGELLQSIVGVNCKAIVMHGYGTGNAPTNGNFIEALQSCNTSERKTHILDVSQCLEGMVNLGNYETSAQLLELGVLSGADITPEAALCKLMVLLGDEDRSYTDIERLAERDICGEQSQSVYLTKLEDSNLSVDSNESIVRIPGKTPAPAGWAVERVRNAYLRLRGVEVSSSGLDDKEFEVSLTLFHNINSEELQLPPDSKIACSDLMRNSKHISSIILFDITDLIITRKIQPSGQDTSFAIKINEGKTDFRLSWESAEIVIIERSFL